MSFKFVIEYIYTTPCEDLCKRSKSYLRFSFVDLLDFFNARSGCNEVINIVRRYKSKGKATISERKPPLDIARNATTPISKISEQTRDVMFEPELVLTRLNWFFPIAN